MRLKQDRKHSRQHIRNEDSKHELRKLRMAHWAFWNGCAIDQNWLENWWLPRQKDRKPCSCDMCGNPRRHWKQKPISERRLELMEAQDDV